MKKTEEKVRASFECDKGILDDFRKLVVAKYGRLWGFLTKEFNEALKDRSKKLEEELNANS